MRAVNLGCDTDTTACIAGGIAGLVYGAESFPSNRREMLIRRDYVEELAGKLARRIGG